MKNFNFTPVFQDVNAIANGQNLNAIYIGKNFEKDLIILKYESSTLMVVLKESENQLNIDFIKSISSRNGIIINGIKIVGNGDIILLLDVQGKLWKLINAFEFLNEEDEIFFMIKPSCFYEWIPLNAFRFQKILQITAYQQGFACLGIDHDFQHKLRIFPSCVPFYEKEYKFEEFTSTDFSWYFLSSIKINIQECGFAGKLGQAEEALVVSNKIDGTIFICSEYKKFCLANILNAFLVTILNFEKDKCLLIVFKCGKLVFIFYGISKSFVVNKAAYLPKNAFSAEKCSCCHSGFLWMDCINLYHTEIKFNFDCVPSVNLRHVQINEHVKGIVSAVEVKKCLLCVTINNFYYQVPINYKSNSEIYKTILSEVITDINHASLEIQKLEEKIKIQTDIFNFKNLIQKEGLELKCNIKWEKSCIVLKYLSEMLLDKNFWKIKLEEISENKQKVEVIPLETDLNKGMIIKIPTGFSQEGSVIVGVIGCLENEVLFVKLKSTRNEKKEQT